MEEVRDGKPLPKRRAPAWARRFAGRDHKSVVLNEHIQCDKCKITGVAESYNRHVTVDEEVIVYLGCKMQSCGHVFLSNVFDSHVYRHREVILKEQEMAETLAKSGDSSGAIRAQNRGKAAEKKYRSATNHAARKYKQYCPDKFIFTEK